MPNVSGKVVEFEAMVGERIAAGPRFEPFELASGWTCVSAPFTLPASAVGPVMAMRAGLPHAASKRSMFPDGGVGVRDLDGVVRLALTRGGDILVVVGATWPDTVLAALPGRRLADVVGNAQLTIRPEVIICGAYAPELDGAVAPQVVLSLDPPLWRECPSQRDPGQ